MPTFPATFLGPLGRIAALGLSATVGLKRAWERRRVVGRLGLMDDHMLRDIGITRQDIHSVLAEPLHRDPTERLAARAAEMRAARRSAAEVALAFARHGDEAMPQQPVRRAA